MACSLKKKNRAMEIIAGYNGGNPFILTVKRDVLDLGQKLTDFAAEYVVDNVDFVPKQIGRIVKIADWYGEDRQKEWHTEFVPEKIKVEWLVGETRTTWHCYVKYRQSMPAVGVFLPKRAVLGNFLTKNYMDIEVDFNRYDRLSMSKDPNRKLKEHQKDAVKFLLARKKCVLADSMGLGKTTSLAVAAIEGNYDSIVIICPASVKTTWKRELMWYVPENDITIIEGYQGKNKPELEKMLGYGVGKSGKKVAELQEEAKEFGKWKNNRFVIINFDILSEVYKIPATWSRANIEKAYEESPMLQYITDRKSLIIIDEVHRLSNSKSIRYKIIRDLIKRGEPDSIFAATGTPITNNPQNFYCVLQLLGEPITDDYEYYMKRYSGAKDIILFKERKYWSDKYLEMIGKTYAMLSFEEKDRMKEYVLKNAKRILIPGEASNLDELKERVSHMYLRRVKEDLPDMVKKEIHEIYYDLTVQQEIEYQKLWDDYERAKLTEDPEKSLNKELLECAIYRKYLSNAMVEKTIALAEDLIEDGKKVVIACCYDEELYTLQEHFKKKCVIYNGKMDSKKKDESVRKFMEDPNIMVFIGNIEAAGLGITLTASTNLIFNNLSFVPGDNQQFMDRIHRLNQTQDVDIYIQLFRDTEYERMWNIVLKKSMVIDQVIKTEKEK